MEKGWVRFNVGIDPLLTIPDVENEAEGRERLRSLLGKLEDGLDLPGWMLGGEAQDVRVYAYPDETYLVAEVTDCSEGVENQGR